MEVGNRYYAVLYFHMVL